MEAALAAKAKAEEGTAALRQAHKAELEAEKAHYEGLLQCARAAQARSAFLVLLFPALGHASGLGFEARRRHKVIFYLLSHVQEGTVKAICRRTVLLQ